MELQLPLQLTEITNIFHHYKDKSKAWKQSGEQLVIKDGDKIVAVVEPYDKIMTNHHIREKMTKYSEIWFPTWALYENGMLKLYDKRFAHTYKGNIPLANAVQQPTIDFKKLMGDIGEEAVKSFTGGSLSENKYDPKKDGLINGHITFEVKTQRLIHKKKAFWIEPSQWNKLDNVDLLYFVKVPEKESELASAYLYYNKKLFDKIKLKGKDLREYPLTNCLFQFTLDMSDSALLLEYSKEISTVERFV